MAQIEYNVFMFFYVSVVIFGILGNIFVIISISWQRRMLKNNYYFLVLHLAICDLGWLVISLFFIVNRYYAEEGLLKISIIQCLSKYLRHIFQFAGIYMMLAIAILRYHAAVYPLKHEISRRKLKIISCLGYILASIVQCGTSVPRCFLHKNIVDYMNKFVYAYVILLVYFAPNSFMAALYYKVYRALKRQNEYLKRLGSTPREENFSSSFKILTYIRNRRTFFICFSTVFCYAVGNLLMSLHLSLRIADSEGLSIKNTWMLDLAYILQVAATASVNPLIYGILDKAMHPFGKCFSWKKQV